MSQYKQYAPNRIACAGIQNNLFNQESPLLNMGLCQSSKEKKMLPISIDMTLSLQQILPPLTTKLNEKMMKNAHLHHNNSGQSEIDLIATDELVNNVQLAVFDEEHRIKIMRDISAQQHRQEIQKQYLIVYDALYHQNRRVPLLETCRQSSLLKRRNLKNQEQ